MSDVTPPDDWTDCLVCETTFRSADFSSRRATRYQGHCPKCSKELRAILTASKTGSSASTGDGNGDGDESTSKYMQALAKDDLEKYRKVFAEYRESSSSFTRGRGHQRQSFNPRSVLGLKQFRFRYDRLFVALRFVPFSSLVGSSGPTVPTPNTSHPNPQGCSCLSRSSIQKSLRPSREPGQELAGRRFGTVPTSSTTQANSHQRIA